MQIDPPSSPNSRGPTLMFIVAVVLILAGGVTLVVWEIGQMSLPASAPKSTLPVENVASVATVDGLNRLAVLDGQRVYTVKPDGSDQLAFEPEGEVPTAAVIWTRDGQHLVYAQTVGSRSQLISAKPDGSGAVNLFEADRASVPFYLNGSPDDGHIAFLISDLTNGLDLRVAALDRADSATSIATGQPNYASWSPDGQALLLHVGGASADAFIGTFTLGDNQPTSIESAPALFQTPGWSPGQSRQWLYARASGGGDSALIVKDGDGEKTLATFADGITFNWSPDGQRVAYALNTPTSFLYEALTVIDADGQHMQIVTKGDVLSFFWSPDSTKLAYLTGLIMPSGPVGRAGGLAAPVKPAPRTVQGQQDLQLTWHVFDLTSGDRLDLSTFKPTAAFLYLIQYFDQFAQSVTVWSPDSRALVYTGEPLVGERGVYVVATQTSDAEPVFVGPGEFAIWSWH